MRFITTFNDTLYRASARELLESLNQLAPESDILVYEELEEEQTDERSVRVDQLPEFHQVFQQNRDVIPVEMGGDATGLKGYNKRWFGWFRKIISEYDALTRNRYDGTTILLDTDVRMIKPLPETWVEKELTRPVGVFMGQRDSVEAGIVVFDGRRQASIDFISELMQLFVSGEFRKLPRWDDSFTLAHIMKKMPQAVVDFAHDLEPVQFTNSNGHMTGGQLIPLTRWGQFFEHDKGTHWRQGVVPAIHEPAIANEEPATIPVTGRNLLCKLLSFFARRKAS